MKWRLSLSVIFLGSLCLIGCNSQPPFLKDKGVVRIARQDNCYNIEVLVKLSASTDNYCDSLDSKLGVDDLYGLAIANGDQGVREGSLGWDHQLFAGLTGTPNRIVFFTMKDGKKFQTRSDSLGSFAVLVRSRSPISKVYVDAARPCLPDLQYLVCAK